MPNTTGDLSALDSYVPSQTSSSISDIFVMITILVAPSGNGLVMSTQEFTSQQTCQAAVQVIWNNTKQKIDTLKCVRK
jgi:hypothetical protein